MGLRKLRNATAGKVQKAKKIPKKMNTAAKVVRVIDGDTCDVAIITNKRVKKVRSRLANIDTPEFKKQPKKASKARDFLGWLSTGKRYKAPSRFPHKKRSWSKAKLQSMLDANKGLCHVNFNGTGKFGRKIATLKKTKRSRKSFNDYLLKYGYAKKYRKRRSSRK